MVIYDNETECKSWMDLIKRLICNDYSFDLEEMKHGCVRMHIFTYPNYEATDNAVGFHYHGTQCQMYYDFDNKDAVIDTLRDAIATERKCILKRIQEKFEDIMHTANGWK
jgi:hypothetical protein